MKPPIERDLKINGTSVDEIEDKWQNAKWRIHERTGEYARDEDKAQFLQTCLALLCSDFAPES